MKKKKKYPSRIKYEKENPAITCRVSVEFKERIDHIREITGKSISQILYETLIVAEKDYSDAYDEGYGDGFDDGYPVRQRRRYVDAFVVIFIHLSGGFG